MPEGVVEISVALLVHKQFIVCVYFRSLRCIYVSEYTRVR